MIYIIKPFSESKNLGNAYNDHIRLLPGGSWICCMDYDTCFLDPGFYPNMIEYTQRYENQGVFTCLTNRTGCLEQRYNGQIYENADMRHWDRVSIDIHSKNMSLKDINKEISGFCMLFNKRVWAAVNGFKEREGRSLGIDNYFCWDVLKLGYKIGLMENVFCFHNYRLLQGIANKTHLK